MMHHYICKTFFFLMLLAASTACKKEPDFQVKINWEAFMQAQDPVFDTLSTKWGEGAFIGNGLLGAMLTLQDSNSLAFEIGRTDVTDHREGINDNYGRCRLPIGRFVLKPAGKIRNMHFRIDLWNAEIRGAVETDQGNIQLRALALADRDVMSVMATTSGEEKDFQWEWLPHVSQSPRMVAKRNDAPAGYHPNPDPVLAKENGINTCYQPLLAGGSYTTAWASTVHDNERVIHVTVSNSYPADESKQQAIRTLQEISSSKPEELVQAHRRTWHAYYAKSFMFIPDDRLESFYWIQQYKMRSATREDALPIDLMGPWYRLTPWPKYWWNLNAQLTYYPFFASNKLALVKPLLRTIDDHNHNLSRNVPEPYRYNAAALGRSSPVDLERGVSIYKDGSKEGSEASKEMGNLTWLLHLYWQMYQYTQEEQVLKNLYPVLKKSINYYLDVMEQGEDGKWHLPYTYSPEYPGGITRDCNYDLSLLRWGTKTLLFINKKLNLQDTLAAKWQEVQQNLTPYPVNDNGLMIGADVPFAQSHRHYSHMLMIYPLHLLNWRQPDQRDLIARSLQHWQSDPKAWRGYSYSGAAAIYATMGKGTTAYQLLNQLMDKFILPNTMYTEAGPVIETPLSAVTSLNELYLQSWGGVISVFPAVPEAWKNVAFHNLRARGAFLVSAVRKNGATQFVRIKSLAGTPGVLKTDLGENIKLKSDRTIHMTREEDGNIRLDLKKGEEAILYRADYQGDFSIPSEAADSSKPHAWGLHS